MLDSGSSSAVRVLPSAPLLSLCLPTYKRAPLLRDALDAVLAQIGPDQAALVEVVVLDNASPDDTPAVVADAGQRWPLAALRSVRHAENIGMDANFLQAIEQAQGQFVCLLSDDDILLPGAVAKLLSLMQAQPDLDGVCLNVRSFRDDPNEGEPWLKLTEDKTLLKRDEVLQLITGHITFLSILAFKKSLISYRLETGYYRDKIGTYFLQSYFFLEVIAHGQGIVVTAQPMIAQRIDNAHPLNYFKAFVTEFNALLDQAGRLGYSHSVIRQSRMNNLVGTRHFVSRVKIYGREENLWSSHKDAIARLFRVFRFHPYLWLVVVPLMFFPRPLRPVVFFVRRMLGRPEVPTGEMLAHGSAAE